MPTTRIRLTTGDFVPVEMSPDDVMRALDGGGSLVQLPASGDRFVFVNPAHVVTAEDITDRAPLVAFG